MSSTIGYERTRCGGNTFRTDRRSTQPKRSPAVYDHWVASVLLCAAVCFAPRIVKATEVVLYPTDDVYVKMNDITYGHHAHLQIRNEGPGGGWEEDVLIRFDLSSLEPGTTITTAQLYLWYYDHEDDDPAGRALTLYRLLGDWDEATVTGENMPAHDINVCAAATVPSSHQVWMNWDVTSEVQAFVNGEPNYGWLIKDDEYYEWNIPRMIFRSKEYGEFSPYLVIESEVAFDDCNGNGIPDDEDIASGYSEDCQPDGVPDECQLEVPAHIQDGLVGYWPLDAGTGDVAYDSSGSGLDGGLSGDVSWTAGIQGGALHFAGDHDYVVVSDNPKLNLVDAFTVLAWFKADSHRECHVASRRLDGSNYQYVLGTGYPTSDAAFGCTYNNDQGGWIGTDPGAVQLGEWYFGAYTYDGDVTRLYFGQNQVELAASLDIEVSPPSFSGWGFYIAANGGMSGYFHGTIDEVRLYDRALTLEELQYLADLTASNDLNGDGVPDDCQDCNGNGILDECDLDCGAPGGMCDVPGCGGSLDCNLNGIPDECDIAGGVEFAVPIAYTTDSFPWAIAIADVNGDGSDDIAVANRDSSSVSVCLNIGDGTFEPYEPHNMLGQPWCVRAGDLNNDGWPDLAVALRYLNQVGVMLNNGDGTFAPVVTYGVGEGPISLAILDCDNDGDADIASANRESDNVSVLRNVGDGTFVLYGPYLANEGPSYLTAADLTGNGRVDLAVANEYSDDVSILLNDGTGGYLAPQNIAAGDVPRCVATGLFDSDGQLDLAVVNEGDNSMSLLFNQGGGTFVSGSSVATGGSPWAVAACDLSLNGRDDLVVSSILGNSLSVFLNDGTGAFYEDEQFAVGSEPREVGIADFAHDGALDLVVANFGSESISVINGYPPVSLDCNNNDIPDECDIADCDGSPWCGDCNANGVPDECDIASGFSEDANGDGIPDECDAALICTDPESLDNQCQQGQSASPQSFEVWNCGTGILAYTISVEDDWAEGDWLSVDPMQGTSDGEHIAHAVTYATEMLPCGDHTATITITDPAAANNPQTIDVLLTITGDPIIGYAPAALSNQCELGEDPQEPTQTFEVWNGGLCELNYTVSVSYESPETGWLTVSPLQGSSDGDPISHEVTYGTQSLSEGTHSASITITDPNATNDPQTIAVDLTVAGALYSIGGAIFDDLEQPLLSGVPDITVSVAGDNGSFYACTGVDGSGIWVLHNVPAGTYTVMPELGGCSFQHYVGGELGDPPPITIQVDDDHDNGSIKFYATCSGGACCLPNDYCIPVAGSQACVDIGGMYQGNGTTCDLPCDYTDCNDNNLLDSWDVQRCPVLDENGNGIPDECEGAYALGDLNCDGVVNNFDIDPFVLALTDPDGYATSYPGCDIMLADINQDDLVNNFDIDPFVALLTGG